MKEELCSGSGIAAYIEGEAKVALIQAVEHPSHYQLSNGVEVIDVIKGALTPEEYKGYLKGNLIKYILRAGKKDSEVQDLGKGNMYLQWLIKHLGGDT